MEPPAGSTLEYSFTRANVLWGGSGTERAELPDNPDTSPQIAIDFFAAEGVSVGFSLGYEGSSADEEIGAATTKLATRHAFAVSARFGYAHMFSDSVGFWPRAGFTYTYSRFENEEDEIVFKTTLQSVGLEGLLVLAPVSNFAVTVGPALDIGVGGEMEYDDRTGAPFTIDANLTTFGLVAGLLGYF